MRERVLVEEREDKHLLATRKKTREFCLFATGAHEAIPTEVILLLINREVEQEIALW